MLKIPNNLTDLMTRETVVSLTGVRVGLTARLRNGDVQPLVVERHRKPLFALVGPRMVDQCRAHFPQVPFEGTTMDVRTVSHLGQRVTWVGNCGVLVGFFMTDSLLGGFMPLTAYFALKQLVDA